MPDLQIQHTEYLPELTAALIQEYDTFYKKYHTQGIYAFCLVLDKFLTPQYTTVSTDNSVLTEHENKFQYLTEEDKWFVEKWQYRQNIDNGINTLTNRLRNVLQQSGLQQNIMTSAERHNQTTLNFYLESMRQAHQELFRLTPKLSTQILFMIWIPTDLEFTIRSLQMLNSPSSIVYEAIASLKARQIEKPRPRPKLSTIEKDLLIDLAQALEMEPYDDLGVAQHAYMLTLEPSYQQTSPYIQHLINDIASMDADVLVMSKQEIQNRIRQFYQL